MRERDLEICIILNYLSGDESLGISSFAADIRLNRHWRLVECFLRCKVQSSEFFISLFQSLFGLNGLQTEEKPELGS